VADAEQLPILRETFLKKKIDPLCVRADLIRKRNSDHFCVWEVKNWETDWAMRKS